jgi:cytochrome c553
MKRLLRYVAYLVVALLVVIGGVVSYGYLNTYNRMARVYAVNPPSLTIPHDNAAAIERGRYLATTVSSCMDCHDKDFGGRTFIDEFVMGTLHGTNLTRGRGGIGASYSDDDFVRAIAHGVRKDRKSVIYMPSQEYRLSADDTAAIVAFLRSLPPVDREHGEQRVGPLGAVLTAFGQVPLLPAERIDHANFRFASSDRPADPAHAGQLIVAAAGCRGCHGPSFEGGLGPPPGGANITPVGLEGWTEADFFRAIREHRRPDGSPIAESMPITLGQMSDDDLKAMYAYLKTVPRAGEKTATQKGAAKGD